MSRTANELRSEVAHLTRLLIVHKLVDSSRAAEVRTYGEMVDVCWDKEGAKITQILRGNAYSDIYNFLLKEQQYNFVMKDGAIIQLLYRFQREVLIEHRVCYLPPIEHQEPSLEELDFPHRELPLIRIDYSPSQVERNHSATHLHIGHIQDCRIPVSAPISPQAFMLFILKSFYNAELTPELETLLSNPRRFSDSIELHEKEGVYMKVPG